MLNYATVGSNQLEEAKRFYDEVLAVVGMTPYMDTESGGRIYISPDKRLFGVLRPFDGEQATVGNGSMFGFMVESSAQVTEMYEKAIQLGGSCEGPPGVRGPERGGNFAAYFRDVDGNKLCAICMGGA